MPKLQSANGRLNVLSKSGCFFYYLFLLFELCHITISLQERINNSSWPPLQCGVTPPPTAPATGFGWKGLFNAAKKGSAGLLLLLWVWKTSMQWGFVICTRDENLGMCGGLQTATMTQKLQALKCPIMQRCTWRTKWLHEGDTHHLKVTLPKSLSPLLRLQNSTMAVVWEIAAHFS